MNNRWLHIKSKRVDRICKTCGKKFKVFPSLLKNADVKYCSRECYNKNRYKENSPFWKGGKIKCICQFCRKEFETYPSRKKIGKAKYCSRECSNSAHATRTGKNAPNWKGGKIKQICKKCGKEFDVGQYVIKEGKGGKYCSKKCADEARSELFSGENHPQWTGGPKEYCVKFNKDLKNRIVAFWFENNNNICPLCEKPLDNKTPHCHHAYYDKKACCLVSEDGKYFSNLGIKNSEKSFEIIGDPNKFAPLHQRCHLRTNSKPKRAFYARKFETIINKKFNGKSYFTKEEYKEFLLRHPEWIPPYK